MNFGFLNIYKPIGLTSHDVVARLRKLTGIKQIGHTGTLDPFAEGVLPVCIGKATRLIEFLADDKEYIATVKFGADTNTYDKDGEIVFTSDKKISASDIEKVLENFKGEISQLPPMYSAIKVKGKKLYEYARKGEKVEISPRKVTIEHVELKNFDEELQQAEILIKCSKGTYIRSIAHDMGELLGCGGYLIKLVRTQAGKFRVEDSIELDKVDVEKNIINPLEILDLPVIKVLGISLEKVRNGMPLNVNDLDTGKRNCKDLWNSEKFFESDYVILIYNQDEICAVGIKDNDKIKLKKVFL